ncbi:hypothetical protein [Neobacillus sp. PS3-40]|uniref:hypothetical protein n=1 Tax=Neobacillus sp. PS3-40 TaxID=3070679 RepID=UPI0027DF8D6D|nr:hypothetical protein [Neobacillus sp. PS3-40]WML43820.1 hypothetical protein RCG20_18850 [Neobacillus sp. PS3-40]
MVILICASSTEKLKGYLIQAGDHLKPSSLGHRARCIKLLFKWTHDEGFIHKNPAVKLKEPKLGKRIPKFLSELEIEMTISFQGKTKTIDRLVVDTGVAHTLISSDKISNILQLCLPFLMPL